MVNKKRDRNGYKKQLGRYRLSRDNIIALENILRQYADAHELHYATKYGKTTTPPAGRKHMPRVFADMHVKIGRYKPLSFEVGRAHYGIHYAGVDYFQDADSVKFLPKSIRKTRYVEVACRPGIVITFTPLTTTIYAQTHYATGGELKVMREVVSKIERYLSALPSSYLNTCSLV